MEAESKKASTLDHILVQTILHEQPILSTESQTETASIVCDFRPCKNEMQLHDGMTNHPMVEFPVPDDSDATSEPELVHFSHDHPLKLSTLQTNDTCEFLEVHLKCEACMQLVLSDSYYYSCHDCNFLIHKSCVELPSEIQHPFHPDHPLSLIHKTAAEFAGLFDCAACQNTSNGFAYSCTSCNFYLDVYCSSLSNTLSHEAHQHPLNLRQESQKVPCDACHKLCEGFSFGCSECGFNLDIICASYPTTVRNRHDMHQIKLNYQLTERDSDEFCCQICKKKMNIEGSWFYDCADCCNAFHPECICNVDDYRLIKFGRRIDLKGHPHPLTMVLKKGEKPFCCNCALPYEGLSFKCTAAECQYKEDDGLDFSFNLDGFCAQIFNTIDYDSQNE